MKPFQMVDMVMSQQEAEKNYGLGCCAPSPSGPAAPRYPWGLTITLNNDSLDKLGLDADCSVGDMLHLFAMAKVTSVSENETSKGAECRIELQITHIGVEDEGAENSEQRASRRYGKHEEPDGDEPAEDAA